jgi:NAD-dependent deacetylase
MDSYQKAAIKLAKSRHAVALTGAGISVESGIPDFRSAGGLWSRYDPMEYGHIESFRVNPAKVWKMILEMDKMLTRAQPNQAHATLAELENRGIMKAVVTQNVDSLHQRAGSRMVVEFHGHNRTYRCDWCRKQVDRESMSFDVLPPLCACGGPMRPEFVFFGEDIPPKAHSLAMAAAEKCDLMLVVGTSATVAPASYLPVIAKGRGAFILEINPAVTALTDQMTDLHIPESAGKALPAILAALDEKEFAQKE